MEKAASENQKGGVEYDAELEEGLTRKKPSRASTKEDKRRVDLRMVGKEHKGGKGENTWTSGREGKSSGNCCDEEGCVPWCPATQVTQGRRNEKKKKAIRQASTRRRRR